MVSHNVECEWVLLTDDTGSLQKLQYCFLQEFFFSVGENSWRQKFEVHSLRMSDYILGLWSSTYQGK